MQPQIKMAAAGTTATATENIWNKYTIQSISDSPLLLKISESVLIQNTDNELISKIVKANTFLNPKYQSNELHGHSNYQTPAIVRTFKKHSERSISVPRGFLPELLTLCQELNLDFSIEDERVENPVSFPKLKNIVLRNYQEKAILESMQSDQGVLISPTGSGKSVMGIELIRLRGQKSLILVHRKELAKQWQDKIEECMGIETGFIGDGEWSIGDQITIALVQTLASKENETRTLSREFGLVLLDEVHYAPANTFFDVLGQLSAKYLYGLSATVERSDGLEKMIYRAIGPAIASISKQEVEGSGDIWINRA